MLFADPIPLLALAGKAVFKLTGILPNYLGPWLLLAYGLQALAGYGLFRALRLPPLPAALGGLLCLLMPAFLYRYGHFPLLGHWAILVALLLYVRIVHEGRRGDVAAGGAFVVVFVLVNPYLLVMVAAIYAAALADAARHRAVRWRAGAGALALTVGAVAALTVLLGFIDPRKPPLGAGGTFGYYGMNLLSPVTPQLSLWPGASRFILDATGGQYEGYNWLGFGILGLLVLALALAGRAVWHVARSYAALCAAAAAMAVYAVSTQVHIGTRLAFVLPFEQLDLFAAFARVFRSAGRFFWPLSYVLLVLAVVALSRRLRPSGLVLAAGAAVAVQAADVSPLAAYVARQAAPAQYGPGHARWAAALRDHDELLMLPQFLCVDDASRAPYYELGLLAARLGIPTNSAIVNRSNVDCAAERDASFRDLRALATGANPLVFALGQSFTPQVLAAAAAPGGFACRQTEVAFACSARREAPAFLALGEEPAAGDKAVPGERLLVSAGGRGLPFLGAGWTAPGAWGVWGAGPQLDIVVPTTRPLCGPLTLTATILPLAHKGWFPSAVDLLLDGKPAGTHVIAEAGEQAVSMRLKHEGCSGVAHVTLRFKGLRSPKELGMNDDGRLLNWAFQSFSLGDDR